jgi:peptidoglycan/LPS O-acetylase OafA/YrhL
MRNSGIEVLRILAACFVIVLHYHEIAGGFWGGKFNMLVLDFMESFSICAVNIFVAITGYFMINSQKRTVGRMLSLLFQVSLINFSLYVFSIAIGNSSLTFVQLIQNVVPHNYFVILYVVMYLFSPYVNLLINGLTQKGRKRFLYISIGLFSLWPSFVNFSGELLHIQWFGLSSIGAWGSQKGFTIVNFLLLYSIGACLRLESFVIKKSIISITVCILAIFTWALICKTIVLNGSNSAWEYHNPLVILLAVMLLNYFKELPIRSGIINNLAKAAFFCYLIHYYILTHLRIPYYINQSITLMIGHVVISILFIYMISWGLFSLYEKTIGRLFSKLDSIIIKY